ncbi:DNA mismatch repair protein MutT [Streptomyces sp. NRRL F-5122]|uniref:NUDIX domain-containing protein n=1 Tax=Streptomyces sp. NRRL F-5122 TaxID=1609098 RepID=UPI00074114E1|nr:NUDIX hydrolase [Streptomyces sp. NRRL F-5122]KUJ58798.1 DNA mismatch repair protein MutT [Streptomyces sp. NRRL F-5122]
MALREAIVAVLRRGDRVLVVKRGPEARRSGYWAPLSGKLEPGETQEEALVREVREEVGLTVAPLAKVWESETDDGVFRLHWWTAAVGTDEVVADPGEVAEARWVTVEEYLAMDLIFDGDREFFERILPGL